MTPFYRFVRAFLSIITKLIMPIELVGIEKFPKEGSFVLCSNHISYWDPVVLGIAFNRPLRFMAKIELFKNKIFGWILDQLGAFPVDREKNDISAIKKALTILKNGEILAIFLEGTRTHEVDLDGAKEGAAMLADRAKTQIFPVYIDSSYKLFRRTKIICRPMIDPKDYADIPKKDRYGKIAADTMRSIYAVGEKE